MVLFKERLKELKQLQSLPLAEKINYTRKILSQVLTTHRQVVVAWSGGKDSTILLYFVLQYKPDIDVIWVNTGVEYPECVKFIQQLSSEWRIRLHVAKPELTFWKVVEKYGYPFFGKGNSGGYWFNRVSLWKEKGRPELARLIEVAKASTECCRFLKEKPANKMYQALGADCILLGNVIAESHQRFLIWAQKGDYYYASSEKRWKAWPISIWTEEDIWDFHHLYNIPHSAIYDKGHKRNGCWPCLMDIKYPDNHLQALRQSHPKLWSFLIEKKGVGEIILALKLGLNRQEMEEYQDQLKKQVNLLVQERPCFFDRI